MKITSVTVELIPGRASRRIKAEVSVVLDHELQVQRILLAEINRKAVFVLPRSSEQQNNSVVEFLNEELFRSLKQGAIAEYNKQVPDGEKLPPVP